ncbi:MAG TPA: hypothetical protein VGK29_06315 [Paludibaculum sp.]
MIDDFDQREKRELAILERIMKHLPRHLASHCPTLSRQHPGELKRRALQMLKTHMRPFPGRPKDQTITDVLQLQASGVTWRTALRTIYPDFNTWTRLRQMDTTNRFRSAKRARARADRKSGRQTDDQNIQADYVSSGPDEREPPRLGHEDEDA